MTPSGKAQQVLPVVLAPSHSAPLVIPVDLVLLLQERGLLVDLQEEVLDVGVQESK